VLLKISPYSLIKRTPLRKSTVLYPIAIILLRMSSAAAIPTKEELKAKLTPLQYHVTQEKGTERPFTSEFEHMKDAGSFQCIVCGETLFFSDHKFDSGCGWPSFFLPAAKEAILEKADYSHGMDRTEVTCKRCNSHLGHVFEDGPRDKTGLRYCINGASLNFKRK
jgi:peptide-methionine (R)-S-oxide reductase